VITGGFQNGATYFINWEAITRTGNRAIIESEKRNLFERIAEAHKSGKSFIIIIDEEHQNDTHKADTIIAALNATNEIRVSATPNNRANDAYYRIDEIDVINEELITRAMFINYELNEDVVSSISHETDLLLEKADEIRRQIQKAYDEKGEHVRPLVLIQFPNMNDDLIEQVENTLEQLGYTYKNKMVARWFSAETNAEKKSKWLGKINIGVEDTPDSITNNDAQPVFLLFKQALSTGWDCPRAKVLVKLRENMNETFEIQTLGRLRRMPKQKHYGEDILDCSFVYTFDEDYKLKVLNEGAYETKRLFIKDEAKAIKLVKEVREQNENYTDDVKIRQRTHDFFKNKYVLSNIKEDNQRKLENDGFVFGTTIIRNYLTGRYTKLKDIGQDDSKMQEYHTEVNLHQHGMDRMRIVDEFKKYVGLSYEKMFTILKNLFLRDAGTEKVKLLNLSMREFTAFIINNQQKLKEDLKELDAKRGEPIEKGLIKAKQETFTIPLQEAYRYKKSESDNRVYNKNVYKDYNRQMTVEGLRSKPERIFEEYCENSSKVKLVYKNGDKGNQYLSVLYTDYFYKQYLFYPDYVIQLADGTIFLAETKGGEYYGQSKNIDRQIVNKYDAFKIFCESHKYAFGFIRDKNDKLFVCNGEYDDDMNNTESWKPIEDIL
ncbi:MAG: DNA helicase, partial [Clostridiales bacterium]|nr:DNA helicase [Clostridiales bacterium]